MKKIEYTPAGICASHISVVLNDNNIIEDVSFEGGCNGNHKGLNALCKGMTAKEAADRLEGITCGFRNTSCPDQLSKALRNV